MDVYSYLEYETDEEISISWYDEFDKFVIDQGFVDAYNVSMVNLFFAQKFEPSLVDKYFKILDRCKFVFSTKKRWCIHYGSGITYTFPYPRTIDDFINDCKRIELNIKIRR